MHHHYLAFIIFCTILWIGSSCQQNDNQSTDTDPNIIIFYVDDLGYGDVGCYGAIGVETPHIDSLARRGIRFTDAHSSASTCTPSRYSLLTGQYAFRSNAKVLPGDAPLLISPDQITLPKVLKSTGYHTAVVGKWHLGLGDGSINWNDSISHGPKDVGFDYSYLIPATGDRVPCVYVEDHKVVNLEPADPIQVSYDGMIGTEPTGLTHPELLSMPADTQHSGTIVNAVSRIGYMSGGESARWTDENTPDILNEKAISYIDQHKEEPFFLFYSFHDIHVPRVIHPDFQGRSSMGPRGDAIAQVDYCIGQIVGHLSANGLLDNTLIIFTSDNGPVLNDGYEDQAIEKLGSHRPAGIYRGGKYSIYEAGTRVPMIVSWPAELHRDINSDAVVTQVDLLASLARLVNAQIDPTLSLDSQDQLNALLGQDPQGREYLLEEGYTFALRHRQWKYIKPQMPAAWIDQTKNIESGHQAKAQLYDLLTDPSESKNIAHQNPQVVSRLEKQLSLMLESTHQR